MPLKDHLKDYFKEPHHAELVGLQAVSYVSQGAALATSVVPVVGNVASAVNMVADAATAIERIRTREPGEHIQKSTIIADWAAVAIDLVGIVFPPVQWGNVALAAWDAKQSYEFLAHRPPAHA